MEKVYDTQGVGGSHGLVIGINIKCIAPNKIEAYKKIQKNFDKLWSYKIKLNMSDTVLLLLSKIFNLEFCINNTNQIILKQKKSE